jgi:hypothetical protein
MQPFENNKLLSDKDVKIMRKDCDILLQDKFKAVDLWKFSTSVKLWEVKHKQAAHFQAMMTDNIRARIESILYTNSRIVRVDDKEIDTTIEATSNYSNKEWKAVLRETCLPLNHRDYIEQFKLISKVVQDEIAGGDGKAAWRNNNSTLYLNNVKSAYEETKAFLTKAGSIVLFLTDDVELDGIDRLQNIPPLFNLIHSNNQYTFGKEFLKQIPIYGDEMLLSNNFIAWINNNIGASHLDFIHHVMKWFDKVHYSNYKMFIKDLNMLIDRNKKVLAQKNYLEKSNLNLLSAEKRDNCYEVDDYDQFQVLMDENAAKYSPQPVVNAVSPSNPFKKVDFPTGAVRDYKNDRSDKPAPKGACYNAIFNNGKCTKPNCIFSHDMEVLNKASKETITKAKEFRTSAGLPTFNNLNLDYDKIPSRINDAVEDALNLNLSNP